MNTSNKSTSAILMVALCFATMEAQACGEVMLRTLGAMRYHPFVTKHPAAIVLYSGEAGPKGSAEYAAKLHDGLEKAGHKVIVGYDPSGRLSQRLRKGEPADMILIAGNELDHELHLARDQAGERGGR